VGPSQLKEILVAQHEQEFRHFMNDETFFQSVILDPAPKEVFENVAAPGYVKAPANAQVSERSQAFVSKDPLVSEVYTNSQNFMKEALKRGHQVGTPMSLETGWDFRRADHRKRAYQTVMDEKPFCLVIAFPCNVFSPLQFLNPHGLEGLPQRRQESLELMRFGIELAKLQVREGRHFILENPLPSAAWKEPEMQAFLEEYQIDTAVFDQCRYGLKSLAGRPHRKATKIASSSDAVIKSVDGNRCTRTHVHDPVIGGAKVTARAGIYPRALARAMVRSVEEQFEKQYDLNSGNVGEVLAAEAEDDEGIDFVQNSGAFALNEDDLSDVEEQTEDDSQVRISQSVKLAIRRLHENTGHRSNVRMARALAIAGALLRQSLRRNGIDVMFVPNESLLKLVGLLLCLHPVTWVIRCTLICWKLKTSKRTSSLWSTARIVQRVFRWPKSRRTSRPPVWCVSCPPNGFLFLVHPVFWWQTKGESSSLGKWKSGHLRCLRCFITSRCKPPGRME
jgi:hypothetical protein